MDWNQDGDFDDADESITVLGTPGAGPYSAIVNPPTGANLGQTRMRIRIMWTGVVSSCGNATYGEVEDYLINVQTAPSCLIPSGLNAQNVTSSSATTVATWTTPTATANSQLSVSGLTSSSAYEWQVESDCGTQGSGFSISNYFNTSCANTDCPLNASIENEPCGTDANGGCNMLVPAYEALACGQTYCGTAWADGGTRDTDWFTFTLTQPSTVTWTVDADFTSIIGFVDASQGCAAPQFFNLTQSLVECGQAVTVDNLAAGTWWVFVGANVFSGYPCNSGKNKYVATLTCTPLVTAANDDCATAISITQNATCVSNSGSVSNATQSLVGCSGTANDDVWFSFVATSTNPIVSVDGSASFDAVLEVFASCAGPSLGCVNVTAADGIESAQLTALTVGSTYYIRVYDADLGIPATTGFDICVTDGVPPPSNDN